MVNDFLGHSRTIFHVQPIFATELLHLTRRSAVCNLLLADRQENDRRPHLLKISPNTVDGQHPAAVGMVKIL